MNMLEQELASAIKFILEQSGNPAPYYRNVPQDFIVPAAYFPVPEIEAKPFSLHAYALTYIWFVKFFNKDTRSAYGMGNQVLTAITARRNIIPLIDADGVKTGRLLRLKDPKLRDVDDGVVQLAIEWDSRRPYHTEKSEKMAELELSVLAESALDGAVSTLYGGY